MLVNWPVGFVTGVRSGKSDEENEQQGENGLQEILQ